MPGYLYVLQSDKSGKYYVGSAVDPERRLEEHNSGYVKATHGKGPWRHVCILEFNDAKSARQAEYLVKRYKRRDIVQAVVESRFAWPDDLATAAFGVAQWYSIPLGAG